MNNSFLLWLGVAGAIAVGLLLLLGTPAAVDDSDATEAVVTTRDVAESAADESVYWEPVSKRAATVAPTATVQVVYVQPEPEMHRARPCPSCGATVVTSPCSACGAPCDMPCAAPREAPLVGGCSYGHATPCGASLCDPMPVCSVLVGDPCYNPKPGINRNMSLCVDECAFIQLHSTVPHPACGRAGFRWGASRGSFLDPTASAPIYYAPSTRMRGGEDVWITLTVIAPDGTEYSDHVSLHINNVR